MEPLVEMMQAKGESECRRGMWNVIGGEDELCDFEKVRYIDGQRPPDCEDGTGEGGLRGEGCQSRLDFVRYALIEGIAQEERLGINPIQLGLIASTDGHNGLPGDTDEYDYQGHNSNVDSDLEKRITTDAYAPHPLRNPRRAGRRLGRGELPRLAVRRDAAEGDLRHQAACGSRRGCSAAGTCRTCARATT